tara:strand:- start:114 stop:242 length:129 start_codon:yes stop_codon:yes gene_type:complete
MLDPMVCDVFDSFFANASDGELKTTSSNLSATTGFLERVPSL